LNAGIPHELLCVVTDAFAKETNMHTTRSPAQQNQAPQILSAGWDAFYESPSAVGARPEEFFNSRVSLATVCPETALMYAVLEDAFVCFKKQFEIESPGIQLTAREAGEWFFSDDSRWLFSFVSVCDALGLEPEFIRKRLKRLSQSHLD
jgi:hypothetical protein